MVCVKLSKNGVFLGRREMQICDCRQQDTVLAKLINQITKFSEPKGFSLFNFGHGKRLFVEMGRLWSVLFDQVPLVAEKFWKMKYLTSFLTNHHWQNMTKKANFAGVSSGQTFRR